MADFYAQLRAITPFFPPGSIYEADVIDLVVCCIYSPVLSPVITSTEPSNNQYKSYVCNLFAMVTCIFLVSMAATLWLRRRGSCSIASRLWRRTWRRSSSTMTLHRRRPRKPSSRSGFHGDSAGVGGACIGGG